MKRKSACFTGHRESKLPFSITSKKYETLENRIKEEIVKLINLGVLDFYVGGQTGIDTTCAQLVIYLKNELQTTVNLHLIIPYKGMEKGFSQRQKDDFEWIIKNADSVTYLYEKYTPDCFRDRNQYMIDRSDYLVAVWDGDKNSGTWMTVNMGKRANIDVCIVNLTAP